MNDYLKTKNVQNNNRICIYVNDQAPQFFFVTIHDIEKIYLHNRNEFFTWVTKIATQYMTKSNLKVYDEKLY
jgi:hypothetical protein